jgi:hypothetical protein
MRNIFMKERIKSQGKDVDLFIEKKSGKYDKYPFEVGASGVGGVGAWDESDAKKKFKAMKMRFLGR